MEESCVAKRDRYVGAVSTPTLLPFYSQPEFKLQCSATHHESAVTHALVDGWG